MSAQTIRMLISIIIYMVAIILIGIYYAKRANRNTSEFYLGGRSLGPFVTAMSAEASDMSGWLLMGLPGLALLCGIAEAAWTAIGLAIGTYLNWLIVAKRIRRYSAAAGDAYTIPQFFSNRFREKHNILMTAAALVIIVFFVPYTASGFMTCGKLFSSLFGLSYEVSMLIAAAIIVAYTVIGGFLAASVTDFVQSIVMTVALFVVIIFGVICAGGFSAVFENAQGIAGYLSLTEWVSGDAVKPYSALDILSTLAWGLGYFGMPHVLLRFMAIKDDSKLKLSRRVATVWVVISMAAAILIGIIGSQLVANGTIGGFQSTAESERIIVEIAKLLSESGVVWALVAGVILAGILAATMSTADSQLLTAASAVSENLVGGTFGMRISKKTGMWIARITVLAVSLIAVFIAWNPESSVFEVVSFAWAGFGATFGPLMLCCLFWRRTNLYGAISGMLTGGAVVFLWKFLVRPNVAVLNFYELLPAFLLSGAVIIVVSLLTKAPDREVTDVFDRVKAMK